MAKFTFADFQVFAGTTKVSEDAYVTIAKGVLAYINRQYGIYPEVATISEVIFSESGQLSFVPEVYPIVDIRRVTYDDDIIDPDTYTWYGEDILFDAAVADIRKPMTFELDVGYPNGVPDDLILAIYRHMLAVYYSLDKHTDNVDKVVNPDGNATFFKNDVIPAASRFTYEYYAGHILLSF